MCSNPKLILIATSSPCNAKCPHCPCTVKPSIRDTDDKFIRLEYFTKIADECAKSGIHLRLSGYGEPLMHPQFDMLIVRGVYYNTRMSLITNGSLIHKHTKYIQYLDSIEVSVDSHKKEIYGKIRVGLNFNRVVGNVRWLMDARDKFVQDYVVMVSIINQPSRNPDIKGAVEYWEKIVDKVMVRKYVTWGVLPKDDCEDKPPTRGACPYPFERMMIDPAGNFRLCPYDDQKLIEPFGHISRDSIRSVWNSPRMKAIRDAHNENRFDKAELCRECTDWAYRSWEYNYWKALKDGRDKIKTS